MVKHPVNRASVRTDYYKIHRPSPVLLPIVVFVVHARLLALNHLNFRKSYTVFFEWLLSKAVKQNKHDVQKKYEGINIVQFTNMPEEKRKYNDYTRKIKTRGLHCIDFIEQRRPSPPPSKFTNESTKILL